MNDSHNLFYGPANFMDGGWGWGWAGLGAIAGQFFRRILRLEQDKFILLLSDIYYTTTTITLLLLYYQIVILVSDYRQQHASLSYQQCSSQHATTSMRSHATKILLTTSQEPPTTRLYRHKIYENNECPTGVNGSIVKPHGKERCLMQNDRNVELVKNDSWLY